MKKISLVLLTVMIIFLSFGSVFAGVGVIDTSSSDEVYKFSNSNDIKLPFIRGSADRIVMDKDVIKSGITFASKNIDLTNKFKGIQTLVSGDTVKVTGEMEYGLIIAPNVIIEGNISKTLFVLSEKITVLENAIVNEDLICTTGNLDVKGTINGSLIGTVGDAKISGNILKDLRIKTDSLNVDNGKIKGEVYLSTTNTNLKLANYPNAIISLKEMKKDDFGIDYSGIIRTTLIFAIAYILISTKTNIFKNMLKKVKEYRRYTVISGVLITLTIPLIYTLLFILSIFGLYVVTVPTIITYSTFIIIAFSLSTFILGSIMTEYIKEKYSDKFVNVWYRLIGNIVIFLILGFVTIIPMVGMTIAIIMCMLSAGILFTNIFKKQ